MSNYVIDFTDPLTPGFTIAPGAYNGPGGAISSTTLRLYGQGAREWGESVNEDLIKLLENFMSATAPANPVNGQLWIETFLYFHDTTHQTFYTFDLVQHTWNETAVISSTVQPTGTIGRYWYNPSTDTLSMYFSAYKQQSAAWHTRSLITGTDYPTNAKPLQQCKVYDVSVGDWMAMPVVEVTSDSTAPANNRPGTFRYNASAKVLYVWDGSGWDALSTSASPVFTGVVDANTFKVINVADATNPTDAVNLRTADARYVALSGGTMTGPLNLSGAPTNPAHAATKSYVDNTASAAALSVSTFPIGGIIMWSNLAGAVPTGWHLCDGTGGTPDLRDKFVIAAGTAHVAGDTGGNANATVVSHTHTFATTTDGSGAHSHTGSTDVAPDHTHGYQHSSVSVTAYTTGGPNAYTGGALGADVTDAAGTHSHAITTVTGGVHTHTLNGTTNTAGTSGANANLPPYFALAFIMKIA